MLGVNTGNGGRIAIGSVAGDVIASQNVAQANATPAGGDGGQIHIEAGLTVTLDGATIEAQGDTIGTGGFGIGGQIGPTGTPIRAFNGPLSWATGVGNAQPTGSPLQGGASGVINLSGCGSVTATASFPVTQGSFSPTISTACGGAPTLPSYVTLPSSACDATCNPVPPGQITGIKWNDLNGNGVRDPGEPGLAGWQIGLFVGPVQVGTAFTDDTGAYIFEGVAPGTYDVCEYTLPGWIETFPSTGPSCLVRTRPGSLFGHQVIVQAGQVVSDINFGNRFPLPPNGTKSGRKWQDLNGDGVLDPGEHGPPGLADPSLPSGRSELPPADHHRRHRKLQLHGAGSRQLRRVRNPASRMGPDEPEPRDITSHRGVDRRLWGTPGRQRARLHIHRQRGRRGLRGQ